MSARQELAQRIADLIRREQMTIPYGGDVLKEKTYYSISFSKASILDGVVKVYGPKFIQINYQTQYRDMPYSGNVIFESEQSALDFLFLAFVKRDANAAMLIPTKESKR